MELYKLRYNLYNYFFQDTIDYNFSNSYLILWEYSLYALYAIFLLIILFNFSKINKFTLFFLIIFSILIYMFTIIDIKIKTIIDNKDLSNYILHFKLFNTIFIDSYNTNKIPLAFSTTFTSEDDITLQQIKNFIQGSSGVNKNFPVNSKNIDANYKYISFISTATMIISESITVQILAIGGGGGGGRGFTWFNGAKYPGGGGGAGQLYYNNSLILYSGTYTITIGDGGRGGTMSSESTKGGNTILRNEGSIIINAVGGGAGTYEFTQDQTIKNGGSGGGISCCDVSGGTAADKTTNNYFGNNGGVGVAQDGGGGGGGAGGAGENGYYGGGTGGDGKLISITGSGVYYAGGGGGGGGASGGKGGGGRGGTLTTKPENGATFTGSGGGGGYDTGGNGGSGIVIIKFSSSDKDKITSTTYISTSVISNELNNPSYLFFTTMDSSDYLFIKEQSQTDDNTINEINELIKYNYNTLENKKIISIETINSIIHYKINIKKFDENKRTSKIIQVLTKKIQKYFYDTYNTIPKINTETQQEFDYLQTLITTDTKNYLYNFYNTLKIINNEIRYIDNIEENKIYANNHEYIKNNNILKFIDIYDYKYLILKKYIFIKIDETNELHKYIKDNYDNNKSFYITSLININNNQLEQIKEVIIDISSSYSSLPADSKTYFLIDIETINKYFNKNKDEKNDHINDYIVYIYDNLKLYYSNKIGIKIENFDILYDSNSKLLLKNLNKPIDEFKLNFNINLVVVIILLTIILHIFYIEYYYKFR